MLPVVLMQSMNNWNIISWFCAHNCDLIRVVVLERHDFRTWRWRLCRQLRWCPYQALSWWRGWRLGCDRHRAAVKDKCESSSCWGRHFPVKGFPQEGAANIIYHTIFTIIERHCETHYLVVFKLYLWKLCRFSKSFNILYPCKHLYLFRKKGDSILCWKVCWE